MTNGPAPDPEGHEGPCWVILGGSASLRGIHMHSRPTGIALGKFPWLLPIVVACPTFGDAQQINEINTLLERQQIERNNYAALKSLFSTSMEISELLTGYRRWYAIRYGKETGIWVGFHWDKLKHNKETNDAEYKGHPTMREALLFMIEKAPYNQPLKTIKSAKSSPVKVSRPAPVANSSGHLAQPPSFTSPPSSDIQELVTPFSQYTISGSSSFALQVLREVIQPLPSQVPAAAGRGAFALGPCADAFLRGRRASNEDLLKILRARLYTSTALDFAHYLSVELEWSLSEGEELWELVELPGL